MSDESNYNTEKTVRIIVLSVMAVILGFFLLLFKSGWCTSTPSKPEVCREEFIEVRGEGRVTDVECMVGATVEVVSSPPSPKAGFMCKCPKNGVPAASSSN